MDSVPYSSQVHSNQVIAIPLHEGSYAYVSGEDADLAQYRWYLNSKYVKRTEGHRGPIWKLHYVIIERVLGRTVNSGMFVDHINGDTLDNRRCNLREVTPLQNQHNKKHQSTNSHGYKGVILDRSRKTDPYIVRIRVDGKRLMLGHFPTPEEAARAYDCAAVALFGEHAWLNFPLESRQQT